MRSTCQSPPTCWTATSPLLRLHVECGSGTYVRSLVRDLGEALGCGAHVAELRRLWVDPFREPRMWTLEAPGGAVRAGAASAASMPACCRSRPGMASWPSVRMSAAQAARARPWASRCRVRTRPAGRRGDPRRTMAPGWAWARSMKTARLRPTAAVPLGLGDRHGRAAGRSSGVILVRQVAARIAQRRSRRAIIPLLYPRNSRVPFLPFTASRAVRRILPGCLSKILRQFLQVTHLPR